MKNNQFHCQIDIEGGLKCQKQCTHCYDHYKPIEQVEVTRPDFHCQQVIETLGLSLCEVQCSSCRQEGVTANKTHPGDNATADIIPEDLQTNIQTAGTFYGLYMPECDLKRRRPVHDFKAGAIWLATFLAAETAGLKKERDELLERNKVLEEQRDSWKMISQNAQKDLHYALKSNK